MPIITNAQYAAVNNPMTLNTASEGEKVEINLKNIEQSVIWAVKRRRKAHTFAISDINRLVGHYQQSELALKFNLAILRRLGSELRASGILSPELRAAINLNKHVLREDANPDAVDFAVLYLRKLEEPNVSAKRSEGDE